MVVGGVIDVVDMGCKVFVVVVKEIFRGVGDLM